MTLMHFGSEARMWGADLPEDGCCCPGVLTALQEQCQAHSYAQAQQCIIQVHSFQHVVQTEEHLHEVGSHLPLCRQRSNCMKGMLAIHYDAPQEGLSKALPAARLDSAADWVLTLHLIHCGGCGHDAFVMLRRWDAMPLQQQVRTFCAASAWASPGAIAPSRRGLAARSRARAASVARSGRAWLSCWVCCCRVDTSCSSCSGEAAGPDRAWRACSTSRTASRRLLWGCSARSPPG